MIRIRRKVEGFTYVYEIEDWEAYTEYLGSIDLPKPEGVYRVTISFDTKSDFEFYHGNFDKQVPGLLQIRPGDGEVIA